MKRYKAKKYSLEDLPTDSPWKSYEGCEIKYFVENNFLPLQKNTLFFKETFSKICKEISFVKRYSEVLQRDYWFVLYYLGEDKEGSLYCVGGEPEKRVSMGEKFKKVGWIDYPVELLEFWKIHGFWFVDFLESESFLEDLDALLSTINNLCVPHYRSLKKFVWEYLVKENYSFELFSLKEKHEFFIDRYILDGIYFSEADNSDKVYLVRAYDKENFLKEFYEERKFFSDFNEFYTHLKGIEKETIYDENITQFFIYHHDSVGTGFYDFYDYLVCGVECNIHDLKKI